MNTTKDWLPVQFDKDGFVRPDDPSPFSWMYSIHAPYPRYPGWIVGSDGAVWSEYLFKTRGKWKRLVHQKGDSGYDYIHVNKPAKTLLVHRVIAETFLGPPVRGKWLCRHLNGNPLDNRLQNLKWGTVKENSDDDKRNYGEFWQSGEKHHAAKLTRELVRWAVAEVKSGRSRADVAKQLGVSRTTLSQAVRGQTWKVAETDRVPPVRVGHRVAFSDSEKTLVMRMRNEGRSAAQIARDLGRPFTSIVELIKKICPKDQWTSRPKGSQNRAAKITEADIPVIRDRFARGDKVADIAASYGLGKSMVRNIVKGSHWSHVPLAAELS